MRVKVQLCFVLALVFSFGALQAEESRIIGKSGSFLFGTAAGDVNSDGIDDLLLWAKVSDGGEIYVFFGGNILPSGSLDEVSPDVLLRIIGHRVTDVLLGDFNKDGIIDVAVLAVSIDLSEGKAYLFFGPLINLAKADVIISGLGGATPAETEKSFGDGGAAGDVNGDGYEDILIASEESSRLYLFLGRYEWPYHLLSTDASTRILVEFPICVDVGKVNDDQYDDIVIGLPFQNRVGECYLLYGRIFPAEVNLFTEKDSVFYGPSEECSFFGRPVLIGKEREIVVGCLNTMLWQGRNDKSVVYIFNQSPAQATTIITAPIDSTILVPLWVGDLDNDGEDDLIASDPLAGDANNGALYVLSGPLEGNIDLATVSPNLFGYDREGLGSSGLVGDFDNNGSLDLAIGGFWWKGPMKEWTGGVRVFYSFTTNTEFAPSLTPVEYALYQNHPNPFNPTTTIDFAIKKAGNVKVTVFNILGEQVATLVNSHYQAGPHTVAWYAANMASGVYFYRIEAGEFTMTKKMMLVR